MSKEFLDLPEPVEFLGVSGIVHFEYGTDHALGYYIQGYNEDGDCVLDRDMCGCCCSPLDVNGFQPLTNEDIQYFHRLFDRFKPDLGNYV